MPFKDLIDKKRITTSVLSNLILAAILGIGALIATWIKANYATISGPFGDAVFSFFTYKVAVWAWAVPVIYLIVNSTLSIIVMLFRHETRIVTRANRKTAIAGKPYLPNTNTWNARPVTTDPFHADKFPLAFGNLPFRGLSFWVNFDDDETRFFRLGIKLIAKSKTFQNFSISPTKGLDVRIAMIKNPNMAFRFEMHIGSKLVFSNDTLFIPTAQGEAHVYEFPVTFECVDGQNLVVRVKNELVIAKPIPTNCLKHGAIMAWGDGHDFNVNVSGITVEQMIDNPWIKKRHRK